MWHLDWRDSIRVWVCFNVGININWIVLFYDASHMQPNLPFWFSESKRNVSNDLNGNSWKVVLLRWIYHVPTHNAISLHQMAKRIYIYEFVSFNVASIYFIHWFSSASAWNPMKITRSHLISMEIAVPQVFDQLGIIFNWRLSISNWNLCAHDFESIFLSLKMLYLLSFNCLFFFLKI